MKIEERIKMEDIATLNLILSELNEMIKEIENEDIENIFNDRINFKFANDFIYFAKIPHTIGGLTVLREKIMKALNMKCIGCKECEEVIIGIKKDGKISGNTIGWKCNQKSKFCIGTEPKPENMVLKEPEIEFKEYIGSDIMDKTEKLVIEEGKKEKLEFISSITNDDESITITFTNENLEDLEYGTEMMLYHLDMMLEKGIIYSHAYMGDDEDETKNVEITIRRVNNMDKKEGSKMEYQIEDYNGNTIGIIVNNNGKIDVDGEIDIADWEDETTIRVQINNPIFTYEKEGDKITKETILKDLLSIEYEYGFFDGKWDSNEYDREEPSIHYYDEMCKYATKYQIAIPSEENVLDKGDTIKDIEDWVIQERIATILKDTLREKLKELL